MKSKEDPEWERKVGQWIEDVLHKKLADSSDLYKSLQSGTVLVECVLCTLMD